LGFGILAGITALGALAAFFGPRMRKSWAWAKGFLRLAGYPLLLGLLLGGIEWLVSDSLYNALGVGTAAYALAQIAFGFWAPRLTRSLKRVQELTDKNEQLEQLSKNLKVERDQLSGLLQDTKRENAKLKEELHEVRLERDKIQSEYDSVRGSKHWGDFQAREIGVSVDAAPLRAENDKLREELHQTKQELEVSKAGERRKRIEKWRAEILNHHFQRHPLGGSWFAQTETYLEMQAHLPPKIRERFESQTTAALSFLGPAHLRGTEGDRRILLREVARIEKEWGVI
jgi:hypothetical protein